MRILFIYIWVILILMGCEVSQTSIGYEFKKDVDKLKLWTFLDSKLDTVVLFDGKPEKVKGSIELNKIDLPVLVYIQLNEVDTSFIIENKEGICIRQNDNKTLTIDGCLMESTYQEIRQILEERYEVPLQKIKGSIENLESKTFLTTQEKHQLNADLKKKERLEYYKNLYIKNLIEKNSMHELSLVLLIKEFNEIGENKKKEVFESLNIKNKNSTLYKFAEVICQ